MCRNTVEVKTTGIMTSALHNYGTKISLMDVFLN